MDDMGVCQRPFRAAEDGDVYEFIQALPSCCCLAEYHGVSNISNTLLFTLDHFLNWSEPVSGAGASHLNGIGGLPEAAKRLRRGDIIATYGGNGKKSNEVIQERQNARLAAAFLLHSVLQQEQFERLALSIHGRSTFLREWRKEQGVERKDGLSEFRRLRQKYDSSSYAPDRAGVKKWVLNMFDDAFAGRLNAWDRGNILKEGRDALLVKGIARAATWTKKFHDTSFERAA